MMDGSPFLGSVHTTHVYGPCLRAVNTGVQYRCRFGRQDGSCTRVVWTGARAHGR